ncbi:MAG: c-type cytochrome [candidate division NC10 bacterium]|nr:c-type cytochrome [candidate division NC10 bacterium]
MIGLWRLLVPPEGRRLEYLARVATAGLFVGLTVAVLAGILGPFGSSRHEIGLVARQPGAGGWSRERIVVNQGERVRLQIRSEDVVHGFAIGRLPVDAGAIEPGKAVTIEFVADQAGEFTFYCTMWCDPNHPRMRGILEVRGQAVTETAWPSSASDILLQHLDDPRDAGVIPPGVPSAIRGLPLYGQRCVNCHGERGEGTARTVAIGRRELLVDGSPVGVFRMLGGMKKREGSASVGAHGQKVTPASRSGTAHAEYAREWSDQERWDVVAALWAFGTTADRLDVGRRLFQRNCAACHGEAGRGDGPGGRSQPKQPADFTDARRMLAGTGELYTAKIRRGGMGTGMPYWGSIFTEEELAALVDYLWTFSMVSVP